MKRFDPRVFMASVRREAGEGGSAGVDLAAIRHMLALPDHDFLVQAYRAFLNRDPDPAGIEGFGPQARNLPGRLCILASLWLSPERVVLPGPVGSCLKKLSGLVKKLSAR